MYTSIGNKNMTRDISGTCALVNINIDIIFVHSVQPTEVPLAGVLSATDQNGVVFLYPSNPTVHK